MAAAAIALVVANSPLAAIYFRALNVEIGPLSLLHWINDALMALFFLLVGLEIKREFVDGELSTWRRRVLPGLAAAGGMIVPALIYLAVNTGEPANFRGWAVPTATDIAFALGVLVLFGKRVPVSLKIFLTALAIIDDLGAVAIIALVYTKGLAVGWLLAALGLLAVLWGLNRLGVRKLPIFLILGAILWVLVFQSGIHPTLAGVGMALTIPLRPSPGRPDDTTSPLHILEHSLQPWVGYLVLPLFGFANAGVTLHLGAGVAFDDIPLGIAAGLFFGKQIGVFSVSWAAIKLRLADCPRDASMMQLYGVSILCGIGFTMSLFIGSLAFPEAPDLRDGVKLGVLAGSISSALAGTLILLFARREVAAPPDAG